MSTPNFKIRKYIRSLQTILQHPRISIEMAPPGDTTIHTIEKRMRKIGTTAMLFVFIFVSDQRVK